MTKETMALIQYNNTEELHQVVRHVKSRIQQAFPYFACAKLKEEEVVQRLLEMAEMYGMGGKDKKYGVGQGNAKSHSIQSLTEGG
jgi:hypothetical protein